MGSNLGGEKALNKEFIFKQVITASNWNLILLGILGTSIEVTSVLHLVTVKLVRTVPRGFKCQAPVACPAGGYGTGTELQTLAMSSSMHNEKGKAYGEDAGRATTSGDLQYSECLRLLHMTSLYCACVSAFCYCLKLKNI